MSDYTAAFEVIDQASGHRWMIYPDGQVRGFGPGVVIINRIPALLQDAARERDAELHVGTHDQLHLQGETVRNPCQARNDKAVSPALKIGDRIIVHAPSKQPFRGLIVGEGRGGEWWIVKKDGTKSANGYAKDFCRLEETP